MIRYASCDEPAHLLSKVGPKKCAPIERVWRAGTALCNDGDAVDECVELSAQRGSSNQWSDAARPHLFALCCDGGPRGGSALPLERGTCFTRV